MVDLKILKSELEPQEDEWYHLKITLNTNKIISFFIKERIEISQYDPNSKPICSDSTYSISTADPPIV